MQRTGEWIRLMSLLILSALLIGWVGYFGAKLTQSVELSPPQTYAEILKSDIEQVLEALLGPGKAQVVVQADVAQEHEVVRTEQVTPHPSNPGETSYAYTTQNTTRTLNKKAVYRLSVTIMVDGVMTKTSHGDLYQPRSPREMETITTLVKNLIGFSSERGDTLEVLNVPFSVRQTWGRNWHIKPWLPLISLLLVMGLSFVMLWRYVFPQLALAGQGSSLKKKEYQSVEADVPGQLDMIRWLFKTQPVRVRDVLTAWGIQGPTQRQAAVLLLALGEESIQQVFKDLPETHVRQLAYLMGKLSVVDGEEIARACQNFLEAFSGQNHVVGGKERLQPILQHTFGTQKADTLLKEMEGVFEGKNIWEKLDKVPTLSLAKALEAEYPQTIALILYHLSPTKGAELLGCFSEGLKMDVLMRLSALKPVDAETLSLVEESLNDLLQSSLTPQSFETGKEKIRTILREMDQSQEGELLQTLYERSPELVQDLTVQPLTFDDCRSLSRDQLQTLLKTTETKTIALALKGASDEVKDVFSKGMTVKDWMQLMKEMTKLGAVRIKDIDEAQHQIMEKLKTHTPFFEREKA